MGKFTITRPSENFIEVSFASSSDLKATRQLEWSSRLINCLKPDENNVWRPGKRSDFYIVGFDPSIKWTFPSNTRMVGEVSTEKLLEIPKLIESLTWAIENHTPSKADSGAPIYRFAITDGKVRHDYKFHSRARTICALAVLYDLEWHPRRDLEIWINFDLTDKLPIGAKARGDRSEEQYYGDPSKTADVLRNEGWTREAETPFMFVEARNINGQSQQHYRISQREQPLNNQVKRSIIKNTWRNLLFERDAYTCQICLSNYKDNVEYLSPDHRIPVVFEPDNLTEDNFLEKLMTLCRFCNQQKREFTKRLRFDYDWQSSPWAYPEKNRLETVRRQIKEIQLTTGLTLEEVIAKLAQESK